MKEIVNRLHERRQVELAKSILESNGYEVSIKKEENMDESEYEKFRNSSYVRKLRKMITYFKDHNKLPKLVSAYERVCSLLDSNPSKIFHMASDLSHYKVWRYFNELEFNIVSEEEYEGFKIQVLDSKELGKVVKILNARRDTDEFFYI